MTNTTVTALDTLSIGDLVFDDIDGDGLYEPGDGDSGIAGVVVNLYTDANTDGVPDGPSILSVNTGLSGEYAFNGLAPGNYLVGIAASNFLSGSALATLRVSSAGSPHPDDDVDNDDNGVAPAIDGGEVFSRTLTLTYGGEPTDDADADADTNTTVDFGFTNLPPTINNLDGDTVDYTEDDLPLPLDQGIGAIVADDMDHFIGGNLTVAIGAGADPDDTLWVIDTGGITVSGSDVSYNGDLIGTLAGGWDGADLVVTFTTADATAAAVSALVSALHFENLNFANPSSAARTVSVTVTDGDGRTSAPSNVTVNVTNTNDAPRIFLQPALDVVVALPFDSFGDLLLAAGDGNGDFLIPMYESAGSGPGGAIVLGDFNNDGFLDMAVANTFDDEVSILIGDGCGCYDLGPTSPIGVGDAPVSMVAADVNNDGEIDLLIANADSDSVSVLVGDGMGGFVNSQTVSVGPVGTTPMAIAAGDFNGDGDDDFVTANGSGLITVGLSDGIGGFAAMQIPLSGAPLNAAGVAVGDFNGDGHLDIAATDADVVQIFAGDGVGGFAALVALASGAGGSDIALGDFDGNGDIDIAVTNAEDHSVSVHLNQNGVFAPHVTYAVGDTPSTLAVDDFDADGDLDIIVGHQGSEDIYVLNGVGDGTFVQGAITPPIDFITDLAIGNVDPDVEDIYPLLRIFTEGQTLALAPRLVLADPDGLATTAIAAEVVLDAGLVSGGALPGDVLAATGTAHITVTWDAMTSTLRLTTTAPRPLSEFQAVLRTLTFSSGQDPDAGGTALDRAVFIGIDDGGDNGIGISAPIIIGIISVDDAATAQDDAFTIDETGSVTGDVFADNGSGADADVDTLLEVIAVDGDSVTVGSQIILASGALLTLRADGTFDYDTNGAFDDLPDFALSGASNTTATEIFTYTLAGGETATVTITIRGVDSDDHLLGTSGADTLFGGPGNDTVLGGDGDDFMRANLGDDWVEGGAGNDTLHSGAGTDTMFGGTGNDAYMNPGVTDTIIELAGDSDDRVETFDTYSLLNAPNVEHLTLTGIAAIDGTGNELHNRITGNSAANVLFGGLGNDTLIGGDGNDLLTGSGGDDLLEGGVGDDTLRSADGVDTMIGGAGNDLYMNPQIDTIIELAGEGDDRVETSLTYSLLNAANVEHLTLTGTAAIDGTGNELHNRITGNSAANVLFGGLGNDTLIGGDGNDLLTGSGGNDLLEGGVGDDTLRSADGVDTMIGGAGNDLYMNPQIDMIIELAGGGDDRVETSLTYSLLNAANVEHLTLTGTGAIDGTGNGLDNRIIGNSATNILTGGAGADTLVGGGGYDRIFVGGGGDIVRFDAVSDSTGSLRDIVYNFVFSSSGAFDRLDFTVPIPSALRTTVGGTLNNASFNSDLQNAVNALALGAGEAVLFDPNGGTANLDHHIYLIVDANNQAGYQAGQDYLIQFINASGTLSLSNFM